MKSLAVAVALLSSLSLVAQTGNHYGEKVDVNLVLLDAVVTDARGNQILGLHPDDFMVRENGEDQKVESVDYFTNRTLLNSTEENAPFKVERVTEDRHFVFFFDKPSDSAAWQDVTAARNAAKKFVNAMRPGDQVAITGHDVRLKVYSDLTSDKHQLLRALDEAALFSKGELTGPGPILTAVDKDKMMSGSGTVYEALDVLGDSLRPIRGRKNLILFTAGIIEPGQDVQGGLVLNESRFYKPMIQSLNAANVTVYGINLLRDRTPTEPMFHQTLDRMTHDTNGQYYRFFVSFDPVLRKIEQAAAGYYLIAYRPPVHEGRGYQKVSVTVKNPEFKVSSRAGYSYGE